VAAVLPHRTELELAVPASMVAATAVSMTVRKLPPRPELMVPVVVAAELDRGRIQGRDGLLLAAVAS